MYSAAVAPQPPPTLAPASQRQPMRERVRQNCDVRSVIHARRLARHEADVDHMAAKATDAAHNRSNEECEDVHPRRARHQNNRDSAQSPSLNGLGLQTFGRNIWKAPFP